MKNTQREVGAKRVTVIWQDGLAKVVRVKLNWWHNLQSIMPATYRKHGEFYVAEKGYLVAKPGRKSKLTEDRQHRALDALVKGRTRLQAAEDCGVARATFYRWMKTNRQFQAAVEEHECLAQDWKNTDFSQILAGLPVGP